MIKYDEKVNYEYGEYEVKKGEVNPSPEKWYAENYEHEKPQENKKNENSKYFTVIIDGDIAGIFSSWEKADTFCKRISAQLLIDGFEALDEEDYLIIESKLNPKFKDFIGE